VTLPFLLLLLDFWPLGRTGVAVPGVERNASGSETFSGDKWATFVRLVREKLPLIALALVVSILTLVVHRREGAVVSLGTISLNLRLENVVISYVSYILKMLWPARLSVFYPYARSLPGWWVVGAFLVLTGVSVAVIRGRRRYPYLPVGWFWYVGTLVPVIGFVQVGDQAMADRYTYVPLIGLFIIVAWGIPDLLAQLPVRLRTIALPTAAGLVIVACAIAARAQLQYWQDSTTLWTRTLEVTTGNHIAHNNLGVVLADQGKLDDAISHYSEALRIKPNYADAHNNLGVALSDQGKLDEAIAQYSEALRIKPDYVDAHNNLGVALAEQGKLDEAIAQYSEALRIDPDDVKAQNNWGNALASEGKLDQAIAHYSAALHINPDYAEAHNNFAAALINQGKFNEAIAHCTEALRIKPDYVDAHDNLGVALTEQGKLDEAIVQYSEALRINPDDAKAHDNLAYALAKRESEHP
jgi:protein O-mannosyl-transferase